MSSKAIRWGGLAGLLSGILVAVTTVLHPNESDPNAFTNPLWGPVHLVLGLGALLGVFGCIAIYAKLADKGGSLLLPGFVLATTGTAFFFGVAILLEAFFVPVIAASAAGKTMLDTIFNGPAGLLFLIVGAAFGVGFILIGIVNWNANVLPRWAGLLAAVGAPLLGFTPPLPSILLPIGGVLFGAGVAWFGYAIWSKQ